MGSRREAMDRAWWRPPWIGIAFPPLLVEMLFVIDLIAQDRNPWIILLAQAVIIPLFWRQSYPKQVFGLIAGIALVSNFIVEPTPAFLALLVALYTIAAQFERRTAWRAAVVTEIVVMVIIISDNPIDEGEFVSMLLLSGVVFSAFFLGTTIRANRLYLASLEEQNRRLEIERDQQSQLAVIAERTRIAREMHDIVAHSLAVVISLADGAAAVAGTQPATAKSAMEQVARTGRQALAEMRRLVGVLRDTDVPDLVPQPGLAQLHNLVADVRSTGLEVELSTSGVPQDLPPTTEASIYRIIQEALTNVMKHAVAPTMVRIALDWRPDHLIVEVRDDGRAKGRSAIATGHGVTGMAERVALFNGSLQSGPVAPHGWMVRAVLPLEEDAWR